MVESETKNVPESTALLERLKSHYSFYSWLKIARDLRKFPLSRLRQIDRLAVIAKIYPSTMLPPARLYNFMDAVDDVNAAHIPGAIVECGVWSGGALAAAALWDDRSGMARNYHGFDSFEGLPPPTHKDPTEKAKFDAVSVRTGRVIQTALQVTGVCVGDDADSVRQMFQRVGVPTERTFMHAGWFQDTIAVVKVGIGSIAILRIDGDWYDSTKVCLVELYDQLEPGGWVIVDDYGCFTGCRDAVDEYRLEKGITSTILWVDQHCIAFRKTKD